MKISLVYAKQFHNIHGLLIEGISQCLKSMRHTTSIFHEPNSDNSEVEINFYPLYYDIFPKKKNKIYIMFQMEQFLNKKMEHSWHLDYTMQRIKCYDIVWDTFYDYHKKIYKKRKIKAIHFKLGYHKVFDKFKLIKKEYDCSFIGRLAAREKLMFEQCEQFNFIHGYNISEKERLDIINKTKINTNFHNNNFCMLESLRVIIFLMCNKGFVLTENFLGDSDLKKNDCLVTIKKEDFADAIKYFLKYEEERNYITNNAYNYIKKHRRLEYSIVDCMKVI